MLLPLNLEIDDVLEIYRTTTSQPVVVECKRAIVAAVARKHNPRITLYSYPVHNKIRVVAVIRSVLGWQLKETVDFIKAIENGVPQCTPPMKPIDAERMLTELRNLGCYTDYAA